MARQSAKGSLRGSEDDVRLKDESQELWSKDLGEVASGLLTSAVHCFAATGYHATTTRDIALAVGLSPAALYVHFPSKEDVLFEIIRTGHERVLALVESPPIQDIADPIERLRQLVSQYTAYHARYHVIARVAQYELSGLTPEHYAEILRLRHLTNKVFRDAVALVRAGRVDIADVNQVTRAILSLSIDLIRWYQLDGIDSPEELGSIYAELALRMVLPRPEPDGG